MKRALLFLALNLTLGGLEPIIAGGYPWDGIPSDKVEHFGIAGALQTACSGIGKAVTDSKWGSTITCFVLINGAGAAKEALDPHISGHSRDVNDIYANLAGSGFSFLAFSVAF